MSKPARAGERPASSRSSSVIEPPSSACRVRETISTPSIAGRGPYAWTWNWRLASGLHSILGIVQQAAQVLAVGVVLHGVGDAQDVDGADQAQLVGDLLDARDHEPLPLLDGLDERRGLQERLVSAGVEPGDAAAQLLDVQRASGEVRGVGVGDLELAPRRGPERGRDVDDAVV